MNDNGVLNLVNGLFLSCFTRPKNIKNAKRERINFAKNSKILFAASRFLGVENNILQKTIINFCNKMSEETDDFDINSSSYYIKKYGNIL